MSETEINGQSTVVVWPTLQRLSSLYISRTHLVFSEKILGSFWGKIEAWGGPMLTPTKSFSLFWFFSTSVTLYVKIDQEMRSRKTDAQMNV